MLYEPGEGRSARLTSPPRRARGCWRSGNIRPRRKHGGDRRKPLTTEDNENWPLLLSSQTPKTITAARRNVSRRLEKQPRHLKISSRLAQWEARISPTGCGRTFTIMTQNYKLDEIVEATKGTSKFTACECCCRETRMLDRGGIKGTKTAIQDGRPAHQKKQPQHK